MLSFSEVELKLYPKMYITTISNILSEQLLALFTELELRTIRCKAKSNRIDNRKQLYVISIKGEKMLHKFIKIIQPANPKHVEKYRIFLDSKGL